MKSIAKLQRVVPKPALSLCALALGLICLLAHADLAKAAEETPHWVPIGPSNCFIFALARDPFNSENVMSGTYFGGTYLSHDGGHNWDPMVSPFNERSVFSIGFDPSQEGTVYVAAFQAGVYKSTDGGASWDQVVNGLTDLNVQQVAVDPFDSNVVLATTYTGVFKTTDGGASWNLSNGSLPFLPSIALAFDPLHEGVVFVGSLDTRGCFRSTNKGDEWEEYNAGMFGNDVLRLHFDSQTGSKLYACSSAAVAYRLDPTTTTWRLISNGLPAGPNSDLLSHPFDNKRLFIATGLGVYKSDDDGETWAPSYKSSVWDEVRSYRLSGDPVTGDVLAGSLRGAGLVRADAEGTTWTDSMDGMQNLFVGSVATAPQAGQSIVYAGSDRGVAFAAPGRRNGEGWNWTVLDNFLQTIFSITPHPTQEDRLFAGTERLGVFQTVNGGQTWFPSTTGILPATIYGLAQSRFPPFNLYAGSSSGLWISNNEAASWYETEELSIPGITAVCTDPVRQGYALFGTDGGKVYVTVDDGNTIILVDGGLPADTPIKELEIGTDQTYYCVSYDGTLYRSQNQGGSWSAFVSDPTEGVLSVESDYWTPQTVYISTVEGVYKTTDSGVNWALETAGMNNTVVFNLTVDLFDPQIVYATSQGQIYKSTNGGGFWTPYYAGLPAANVTGVSIDHQNNQILYATVEGNGVYTSTDGGQTWGAFSETLPGAGAVPLRQSYANPARFFAGVYIGGVLKSEDSGATWASSSQGISLFVRGITFDPNDSSIMYASSLKDGLFKSTDGGSLWVNIGLPGTFLLDVEIDPLNSQRIYCATTLGVVKSDDGGANWNFIGPYNSENYGLFTLALEINPYNSIIYAATGRDGIFKSDNYGQTWTAMNNEGLETNAFLTLELDKEEPDTLYAGSVGLGVFVTHDGGLTWSALRDGMFSKSVTGLTIDSLDHHVLYAGTEGGGVFRLDLNPLTQSSSAWTLYR